jgi:hypothetical protein
MHLSVSVNGFEGDGIRLYLRHSADRLMTCNVTVRAGGFRAALETEIFVDELHDLQTQLIRMRQELSGMVNFSHEMRGVEFSVVMDKSGRAVVEGTARDLARGSRMFFTFLTDESYLAETVAELTELFSRLG